jgi:hypothetical protein
MFRHVQTCSDMFRHVQTCSDMIAFIFVLILFAYARSAVGLGITLSTFTPSIAPFGHLAILSFRYFTFQDRG